MTTLYLAGPMSGHPELNYPAFMAAAADLRAAGYTVVNPAEINADDAEGWLACMRKDIKALVDCDGVALMPGWRNSRGAKIECALAIGLGLRVETLDQLLGVAA